MTEEKCKMIGMIGDKGFEKVRRVYDTDFIHPAIAGGGNHLGNIMEEKVKLVGGIGEKNSNGGTQYYQQDRIYDANELALWQSANENFNPWYQQDVRIRKLTPRECWRLMGQKDEDYDKAAEKVSASQLYKQAGNSIVVDVLMAIFGEML